MSLVLVALLLLALTPAASSADELSTPAQPDTLPAFEVKKRTWLAATETIGINVLIWSFNRFIREGGTNPGFRIGFNSWDENIHNGFEWDDNSFSTNQFAHPYHGSLYFNAARSNGYGYYGSLVFAMAGSWMWEYIMENHHPSYNDWIATGIGGAALGESLHRLSAMVIDNTATGSGRTWREIGGFFINPVQGFNRLVTGQASKVQANPADRMPNFFGSNLEFGLRTIGEDRIWESDTTRVYLKAAFAYGDPFEGDVERPFDSFDFNIQINFNDKSPIGQAQVKGLLFASELSSSRNSNHLIAAYQHYDYIDNSAYEIGGQSFSASYLSRVKMNRSTLLTTLHANAILMAGSKSDYEDFSGRSYGYGPGMGFEFEAKLLRDDRPFFSLGHSSQWIYILSGDAATHNVNFTYARLNIPLQAFFSLGVEYDLYYAERSYRDFADVSQRNPELKVYMNWFGR